METESKVDKNLVSEYVNNLLDINGKLCEINNGNINSVFRLSTPCEKYIIKVYTDNKMKNNCSRYAHESRALSQLQNLDTIKVPRLIHYSPEANLLHLPIIITENIDGACAGSIHKSLQEEDEYILFQSAINFVSNLNHTPITTFGVDKGESNQELTNRVLKAAPKVNIPNLDLCCDYFEALCKIVAHDNKTEYHFVHGDFRMDNIIVQEKNLYLIDWECAHLGHGEEDLATIIREYLLSAQKTDRLNDILNQLQHYNLQRLLMYIVRRELFEVAFLLKTGSKSFVKCLDRIMKIKYHYTVCGQDVSETLKNSYAIP